MRCAWGDAGIKQPIAAETGSCTNADITKRVVSVESFVKAVVSLEPFRSLSFLVIRRVKLRCILLRLSKKEKKKEAESHEKLYIFYGDFLGIKSRKGVYIYINLDPLSSDASK